MEFVWCLYDICVVFDVTLYFAIYIYIYCWKHGTTKSLPGRCGAIAHLLSFLDEKVASGSIKPLDIDRLIISIHLIN